MKNNFQVIEKLMGEYKTSFYLYDEIIINQQLDLLLGGFTQFEFLYSIKTNPFRPIVDFVVSKGFGADAASAQEVIIGEEAGLPREKIFYSTPGKTKNDIENTIDKAIIIGDSFNELVLINDLAKEKEIQINVGLRINLNYNMEGGKGSSSKFGVDEESLMGQRSFIKELTNIKISGIHVHLRSQVLDYQKLYNYYEKVFKLAEFCKYNLDWDLDFINFGGGLGVVYSQENDNPLDIKSLANGCRELVERFKEKSGIRLLIETGRFVVCQGGQYITYVVDIKESMGEKFLIVEKGLNGFLRPSIVELLNLYTREGEELKAAEPLFTTKDAFEFIIPQGNPSKMERVTIAGSLCTAMDVMVKDIRLPKAKIGDIVIVTKAGSYAYSLSPIHFASHQPPLEFYVKTNGNIIEAY